MDANVEAAMDERRFRRPPCIARFDGLAAASRPEAAFCCPALDPPCPERT
jgi:hypothetical protein